MSGSLARHPIMKILVTGSRGHLGEGLIRTLQNGRHDAIGVDIIASPFTHKEGSIVDRRFVADCMRGVDAVIHTATLHKPHVVTHTRQDFIDTNITGTLNLLEEAAQQKIRAFVFTSTTSVFGHALTPPPGSPAVWVTEDLKPVPKNIYGATKTAAEDLCELFYREQGLATIVLRTSRFFPGDDDETVNRYAFDRGNMKINEYLYRRVDIEDAVSAHLRAMERVPEIGFGRYIITATTPFIAADLIELRTDAARVVRRYYPNYETEYKKFGWLMFSTIERVYVNELARRELGWRPQYDFESMLSKIKNGHDYRSPLTRLIGAKGYHSH